LEKPKKQKAAIQAAFMSQDFNPKFSRLCAGQSGVPYKSHRGSYGDDDDAHLFQRRSKLSLLTKSRVPDAYYAWNGSLCFVELPCQLPLKKNWSDFGQTQKIA
jgi:hypothetical protein